LITRSDGTDRRNPHTIHQPRFRSLKIRIDAADDVSASIKGMRNLGGSIAMGTRSALKFTMALILFGTGGQAFASRSLVVALPPGSGSTDRPSTVLPPHVETRSEPRSGPLVAEVSGISTPQSRMTGGGFRLLDWGTGTFSLAGARLHHDYRSAMDGPNPMRRRGSTLVAGFYVQQDIGADDSIFFAVAGRREHQSRSIDLISRHFGHSNGAGIEVGITHDDRLRIVAGYSASSGPALGGIERSVALARGALAANKGFRLGLQFSPQGFADTRSPSIGFELRRFNLSALDSAALGLAKPGVESAAFTLRVPF
jgi:hypothetical protein